MKCKRIIARLDVKGPNVVKGVHFECLRVIGKPEELAKEYYLQGADELVYIDIVANLYQRQNLFNIVNKASQHVFIPFTIGGGVRTIEDISALLHLGADKVAINTAATKNPEFVREASQTFGSQCIVISIEAQRTNDGFYEAYTDNGRMSTGLEVVSWAKKVEQLGAGEILLTSVEHEGTQRGLDIELIKKVSAAVSIPVIASGGVGRPEDIQDCFVQTQSSAVATASLLHYKKSDVEQIKCKLEDIGIVIRKMEDPKRVHIAHDDYDIADYNKYTKMHLAMEDDTLTDVQSNETPDAPIGVIDYGINNVKSVISAFGKIGRKARAITKHEDIASVQVMILPGVGAFGEGMHLLQQLGFVEAIRAEVSKGKPLLGICLGMQMLFSMSEEFGVHQGLDLIKGRVVKLKSPDQVEDRSYRLPHIGWNKLKIGMQEWQNTLLNQTQENDLVYFVHSYYPITQDKRDVVATAQYGGQEFCVVVQHENISGTQFHPEKSGRTGLRMLDEYCRKNGV